jgi:hypothetical protein
MLHAVTVMEAAACAHSTLWISHSQIKVHSYARPGMYRNQFIPSTSGLRTSFANVALSAGWREIHRLGSRTVASTIVSAKMLATPLLLLWVV